MASEWVKLTSEEAGAAGPIHVNLANASSIYPNGKGSVIWFLAGVGAEGKVYVTESPTEVLKLLSEVRRAHDGS